MTKWVRDNTEFLADVAELRARCTVARKVAVAESHADALLNVTCARRDANSAVQLDKTRGAYHSESAMRSAWNHLLVAERKLDL